MEKKIDTSGWKEYKLNDLFIISGIKRIEKPAIIKDEKNSQYDVALICQSQQNNQVLGYVKSSVFENGNALTVESFASGKVFYQPTKFVAINNQFNSKLILKNKILTENIGLFLSVVLSPSQVHSRSNQRGVSVLKEETVSLPSIIHEDGTYEPDWDYMENYIANLRKKVDIYTQDSIDIIENVKSHRGEKKIDTSGWKEYKTTDRYYN